MCRSLIWVSLLLSIASAAIPQPVVLPITRVATLSPPALNDQARAAEFVSGRYGTPDSGVLGTRASVSASNELFGYTITVNIGSPSTAFDLLVDTGSSNIWVGADTSYKRTRTSHFTNETVYVSYGSGAFVGEETNDQVDLGDGLVIPQQSIGVAVWSEGFSGIDGIAGFGPVDLTAGTVSNTDLVPTLADNLYSQRVISEDVFGIYFDPPETDGEANGEITFGGVDTTKLTSSIAFAPLTTTQPASFYWGINQTISYGDITLLASAGIVDTGTTAILLATDIFNYYVQLINGTGVDQNTGLLQVPSSSIGNMQSLYFNIAGTTFELSGEEQILEQSLNTLYGGSSSAYYSVVGDLGRPSGQGLDFINGYFFLERFYSVFDKTNSQVGFATTSNS